ncbi:kinase response regulator receiver domain protein [Rhizoctonia solani AG-3 Rhs1AP]|uniref:non-specific serine/threonine protein kinase n=1 Tax=Rhizoctonia solani AG-3 Rhs1AP TaxID=1086054 RepID=X8JW63_9AGAM|nr:kinase response regulator receiver domain protein [Rhizoctonia solani AG-3 Rhs1AP]
MSAPPPPSRVSPAGLMFAPTPRDARAPASMLDGASPLPVLPKTLSANALASQQWPSLPPTPSNTTTSTPNPTSNQISMPFIKRHIRRRLTNAKETCDKELHKVIHSITTYVEERLREPSEPDFESYLHDLGNHGVLTNPMTDDESDDDQHETDYRSRQVSASSSPNSFRRPLGLPTRSIASTSSYGEASPSRKASDPLTRQHMAPPPAPNWQQSAPLARRMSRSRPHPGSLPIGPSSNSGSRPASRSRSPLPSAPHESQAVSSSPRAGTNSRRLSRMMDYEEAVDPFMSTLHEMTAIATDVVDMSIAQITSQPKACTEIVQKVQTIGRAWDEHPDWHGRAWYVQLLLAVAGLSRVVEWWEAEKQFWNFDEDDESEMEPMVFVMKPSSQPASANLSSARELPEIRSPLSRASSSGARGTPLDTVGAVSGEITSEGLPENSTLLAPDVSSSTELEQAQSAQTDAEQAQENAQETETLRIQAEEAQAVTIVLELALDGEELLWTNRSWSEIIGSNPEDVIGTAITRLLAPEHADVFVKSTRQLREDDSHTIEVVFQMRIEAGTPEPMYQQFEGKGMLMLDRFSGEPTHTMWVLKPVGAAEADDVAELELPPAVNEVPQTRPVVTLRRASTDSRLGILPRPFSHAPVLCRICECQIPDWFFEKHNETCHELHRLEAEIGEHNDTISDLRTTIRGLTTSLDRASPVVPEYRGVSLVNPSPSPLLGMPTQQVLRPHGPHAPLSNRLQRGSLRRQQHHILQLLDDILQTAQEIAIPALREDQHDIPIERQRLMSPPSEHKIETVQKWTKPHTDDPGLNRLGNDVYAVIRHKVDSVNRLTNTIRYAEKVRREWEEQVELERMDAEPLAPLPEGEEPGEGEGEDGEETEEERDKRNTEDQAREDDDVSSTTSEYAFGRPVSSEPTPMAPSPAPEDPSAENAEAESPTEPGSASTSTQTIPIATPAPRPPSMIVPQTFQGILTTRSSTPSSISSPLATAAPIVAAATPEHMSLSAPNELSPQTVRTRRSVQNVSLLVTPPMSPSVAPQDDKTAKKTRRMSTIQPIVASPTASSKDGPLSPRIPFSTVAPRPAPSTIKDFEIIKPISKGAFGSVFLAKKKTTGDYFAIKVLKKADMIAKNQITNVKAERMILMKQSESPFVVKLYFTFQSKENLYLVMEYLNGGDCASLIKTLGALPEEWTRAYIAEVTLGLEYLHAKGVVHRDLKPDNLLIDQHGHLKLTDFGLSRIGLLGRQTRESTRHTHSISSDRPFRGDKPRNSPGSRPTSMDSPHLHSPIISPEQGAPISYFSSHGLGGSSGTPGFGTPGLGPLMFPDDISESSGSESVSGWLPWRRPPRPAESPMQSFATDMTLDLRSTVPMGGGGGTPPANDQQKFVGTPDYLAPETILGIGNDDTNVDWWALGVITYEFLYGFPPFHASSPQEVFDNIISRRIDWHEDEEDIEYSPEARDFMQRLMTTEINQRLGYNGASEVKSHAWFSGVEWDKVTTTEAQFVPQVTDPESTDYFDARGALPQIFQEDEPPATDTPDDQPVTPSGGAGPSIARPIPISKEGSVSQPPDEDFGAFSYKNLPVLKQANDDVIRKMRTDQMAPMTYTLSEPTPQQHHRRRSVSQKIKKPLNLESRVTASGSTNPPSPSTSTSSIASSPSRGSIQPSTPASSMSGHVRRPSEFGAVERFKSNHLDNDGVRRNSMPSRLRTSSISSQDMNAPLPQQTGEEQWTGEPRAISPVQSRPASVIPKMPPPPLPAQPAPPSDRGLVVLIAEDNPISSKVLETLLTRMGCRCVVVGDGSEAISVAMGDIKFDCILMDYQMPSVDGEVAARLIKTTKNKNSNVPIVAVSAYSGYEGALSQGIFAAALSKPLSKTDLLNTMKNLGFKTSHEGAKRKLSSAKPS